MPERNSKPPGTAPQVVEQGAPQSAPPSRSELDTLRRQLRDQKEQLREHKELLTKFVNRMKPPRSR